MKLRNLFFCLVSALAILSSCDKDDNTDPTPDPGKPKEGKLVIAAIPYMSYIMGNGADLLYTSGSLDSDVVIKEDQGVEQDGTYRNYTTSNNLFFSLLFG